jgi:hypothetical protein
MCGISGGKLPVAVTILILRPGKKFVASTPFFDAFFMVEPKGLTKQL